VSYLELRAVSKLSMLISMVMANGGKPPEAFPSTREWSAHASSVLILAARLKVDQYDLVRDLIDEAFR
jgi:hypothetical protein